MTPDSSAKPDAAYHPLPDLLESVLCGDSDWAREGGWEVKQLESIITIGTYEKPPDANGNIRNVAVFQA